VEFRVDKTGIIHAPVGKTSFASDSLWPTPRAGRQHRQGEAGGGQRASTSRASRVVDDGSGVRIDTTHIDVVVKH
jgi:ribosomal protein L1